MFSKFEDEQEFKFINYPKPLARIIQNLWLGFAKIKVTLHVT